MERKDNKKVPMAILSCFLIAFIIQGILKICGIFIFEKALDWQIFNIIESNIYLKLLFYSLIALASVYCLTFALTGKLFSGKWYVILLVIIASFGMTLVRMLVRTPFYFEFIYDTISYILIPVIINKLLNKNINIITVTAMQILLYFTYLGLCYWSNLLNSLLPMSQTILHSSSHFLIYFEVYLGLFLLTLSLNIFINKEVNNMNWPTNIVKELARLKAKRAAKMAEVEKLDARIEELEKKENAK